MITIGIIAIALLWFLRIRDLLVKGLQFPPAPGGVRRQVAVLSSGDKSNQKPDKKASIPPFFSGWLSEKHIYWLFLFQKYFLLFWYISFIYFFLNFFLFFFFFLFFSIKMSVDTHILLSKHRCTFLQNIQKTQIYCFDRTHLDVTVMLFNLYCL